MKINDQLFIRAACEHYALTGEYARPFDIAAIIDTTPSIVGRHWARSRSGLHDLFEVKRSATEDGTMKPGLFFKPTIAAMRIFVQAMFRPAKSVRHPSPEDIKYRRARQKQKLRAPFIGAGAA